MFSTQTFARTSSLSSLARNYRALFLALVIAAGLWGLQQYQTYQNTYYIGTQAFTEDSDRSCAK